MNRPLHLFEGFGVELEYMVVDYDTLDPQPIVDQLFRDVFGTDTTSIDRGLITWSNELTNHVLELKTTEPTPELHNIAEAFQSEIQSINHILERYRARLLPTAMHPWMDPKQEMCLWPIGDKTIYETYHRIFNCCGHGWANVQSVHLNLPFYGDEEFARLHAAIRLILPLLPALAASSPIVEKSISGWMSSRLQAYASNQKKIPCITGSIVPEAVFSRQEYEDRILQPIYEALAPEDPEGILREEWVNSRGAIARFDRSTIEIRVLDIQENPKEDLLILRLIVAVVRALVEERWVSFKDQAKCSTEFLSALFLLVAKQGFSAVCNEPHYLQAFGCERPITRVREIWKSIIDRLTKENRLSTEDQAHLHRLLRTGNLSERIVKAVDSDCSKVKLCSVYRSLMEALDHGIHQ